MHDADLRYRLGVRRGVRKEKKYGKSERYRHDIFVDINRSYRMPKELKGGEGEVEERMNQTRQISGRVARGLY